MDWGRAKTALICLLSVINIILGAVLLWRWHEEYVLARSMVEDTVRALKEMEVEIDEELLRREYDTLYQLEVGRDTEHEQEVFAALAGESSFEDQGSGIFEFQGDKGRGRISSGGSFELVMNEGGHISVGAAGVEGARKILAIIGEEKAGDILTEKNEFLVYGVQTIDGVAVYNINYQMYFDSEGMFRFEGSRIFGEVYICSDVPSKSASAALLVFADDMEGGCEITDLELGYAASLSAPGYTRFSPVWQIEHSGGVTYIDAITLEIFLEL